MPTTTNTITIKPGEQFTLPPGATIIGSSNSTSLTSSCDATIPTITFGNYYFFLTLNDESSGGEGNPSLLPHSQVITNGISYSDTGFLPFATRVRYSDGDGLFLFNEMVKLLPGLIKDFSESHDLETSGTNRRRRYVHFSCPTYIGDTLRLYFNAPEMGLETSGTTIPELTELSLIAIKQ